ncbi:MAG: phosphoribosylformylglycinamidine synthase subunit PurQ [Patulibacter sp.]
MRIGIPQFPGSCDEVDAKLAADFVGDAELLWHRDRDLKGVDAIVVPGGFSYGDYLRAGAIAGLSPVMDAIADFAREGGPVLGICNGFQVLCAAGLLPGALLQNKDRRFVCRQVDLTVETTTTAWTSAAQAGQTLSIPAKHQEGRYYAPDEMLAELQANEQVVFRYAGGTHNGSVDDIAGVCNAGRNVVGLMPHPEHAVDALTGSDDGLVLFRSLLQEPAHV